MHRGTSRIIPISQTGNAIMRFTIEGTFDQIMDFIGHTALKSRDLVFQEGSISELYGYGDRIFNRIEEKLRNRTGVEEV